MILGKQWFSLWLKKNGLRNSALARWLHSSPACWIIRDNQFSQPHHCGKALGVRLSEVW